MTPALSHLTARLHSSPQPRRPASANLSACLPAGRSALLALCRSFRHPHCPFRASPSLLLCGGAGIAPSKRNPIYLNRLHAFVGTPQAFSPRSHHDHRGRCSASHHGSAIGAAVGRRRTLTRQQTICSDCSVGWHAAIDRTECQTLKGHRQLQSAIHERTSSAQDFVGR